MTSLVLNKQAKKKIAAKKKLDYYYWLLKQKFIQTCGFCMTDMINEILGKFCYTKKQALLIELKDYSSCNIFETPDDYEEFLKGILSDYIEFTHNDNDKIELTDLAKYFRHYNISKSRFTSVINDFFFRNRSHTGSIDRKRIGNRIFFTGAYLDRDKIRIFYLPYFNFMNLFILSKKQHPPDSDLYSDSNPDYILLSSKQLRSQ